MVHGKLYWRGQLEFGCVVAYIPLVGFVTELFVAALEVVVG